MQHYDFKGGNSCANLIAPKNVALNRDVQPLNTLEETVVSVIVDKYGKEVFTFLDHFLRVTIPFNYELDEYIKPQGKGDGTDNESVIGKLSDEEKPIKAIEKNPNITTAEMVKLLAKSRRTVSRIISKSSKIVRVGGDFGGH